MLSGQSCSRAIVSLPCPHGVIGLSLAGSSAQLGCGVSFQYGRIGSCGTADLWRSAIHDGRRFSRRGCADGGRCEVVFCRSGPHSSGEFYATGLVCLAVWMASGATDTAGKSLQYVPPVTVFVASRFDTAVANMFSIPLGLLLKNVPSVVTAAGSVPGFQQLTWYVGFCLAIFSPSHWAILSAVYCLSSCPIGWHTYVRRRILESHCPCRRSKQTYGKLQVRYGAFGKTAV